MFAKGMYFPCVQDPQAPGLAYALQVEGDELNKDSDRSAYIHMLMIYIHMHM